MQVRIRFGAGPRISSRPRKNQRMAMAVGALLTPAAVMALVLGMWRVAADLDWAGDFFIPAGLFSHWQVWLAAAVALQICSHLLYRYGTAHRAEPAAERDAPVRGAGTRVM